MPITIPINAMKLSPGSHVTVQDVSWQQYEALLSELGEERVTPRINYCLNTLELMAPLPAHERPNRIITDIVKTLLDLQDRDWEDFGSTTFRKEKDAGLEPDTCFYIKYAERMRTCTRFDPEQDPPPDLAIESDLTSKTTMETYRIIRVPEVWIYTEEALTIYVFEKDEYRRSQTSPTFSSFPITQMIPTLLAEAKQVGTRRMLKKLKQDLSER